MAQNQQPQLTEEVSQILQKQIQFYFSDANLLTDQKFMKQTEANHNSWVDIAYILKCPKVKEILGKLDLCHRSKKRIVAAVLKNSPFLKINKMKIKRKKPFNERASHENFLYLQVEEQSLIQEIINSVRLFEEGENITCSFKTKNKWIIMVAEEKKEKKGEMDMDIEEQSKIRKLQKMLRGKEKEMKVRKILNGQEWEEWQRRFDDTKTKLEERSRI